MPSGVFKPYAGVSAAILLFTKTNSGGTDNVWFYDMQADGFSLDDKRTPQPEQSDIPDLLQRWRNRAEEAERPRTAFRAMRRSCTTTRKTNSTSISNSCRCSR